MSLTVLDLIREVFHAEPKLSAIDEARCWVFDERTGEMYRLLGCDVEGDSGNVLMLSYRSHAPTIDKK